MANYTLPDSVPRRKNSVGGSTFTRTCNGFIIRKRFVPVQKRSIQQTRNRSKFMATVKNWHALDSTQRASFANSAPTYVRQDSLGNTYQFTGVQLQNSVNQNLHLVNLPPQTTGNDYVAPMDFTISGGGANLFPVTLEIGISPNTVPSDYLVLVSLTPVGLYPFPAFPPNELRQVLALDPGVYGAIDLLPAYEMQFGNLIPDTGQNIVVGIQSFNTATGIKSDYDYIVLFFT